MGNALPVQYVISLFALPSSMLGSQNHLIVEHWNVLLCACALSMLENGAPGRSVRLFGL
jgi:hypothetical protein